MLALNPRMPSVLVHTASGALQAVESSGSVLDHGHPLIDSNLHAMVIGFHPRPLATATQILILPMSTGALTLHRRQPLSNPVILMGEIVDGHWRGLNREVPRQPSEPITLHITEVESGAIFIVCEAIGQYQAIATLETWVSTPWKLDETQPPRTQEYS